MTLETKLLSALIIKFVCALFSISVINIISTLPFLIICYHNSPAFSGAHRGMLEERGKGVIGRMLMQQGLQPYELHTQKTGLLRWIPLNVRAISAKNIY